MEGSFVETKAYKCPFCDFYSVNKKETIKHSRKCRNNPNYTQECLYCHNLESDFKQRIIPCIVKERRPNDCPLKLKEKIENEVKDA